MAKGSHSLREDIVGVLRLPALPTLTLWVDTHWKANPAEIFQSERAIYSIIHFIYYHSIMATQPLQRLPAEIVLEIQRQLEEIPGHSVYASCVALRSTCRHTYEKTENPNKNATKGCESTHFGLKVRAYDMKDLLAIEQWPKNNQAASKPLESQQPLDRCDFFACCLCLKLRSVGKFSNTMVNGKRGKNGQGDKTGRFCFRCGLSHGKYQRGMYLQFGGASGKQGIICTACGEFELVTEKPKVGLDLSGPVPRRHRIVCAACGERERVPAKSKIRAAQSGGPSRGHRIVCVICGELELLPEEPEVPAAQQLCAFCDWDYGEYEPSHPFHISEDCCDWRDLLD
jgi:hypothetical protein